MTMSDDSAVKENAENVEISVIVPVYNVENYLSECVDSILNQTFKDFELILVDDGSKDGSGKICDGYAAKDIRVKVLHKPNGGLSDARNTGMEVMKGQYVTFIDSDDIVSYDYLRSMYEAAVRYKADIVQCGFCRDREKLLDQAADQECAVIEGRKILRDYLRFRVPNVLACAKLIKADLLENVRFPLGIIDEDNYTTYKLMARANTFVSVDAPLYYYRVNPDSITQITFHSKRLGIFNCVDEIRKYLGKKEEKRYDRHLKYYQMRLGVQLFNQAIKAGKEKEFAGELAGVKAFLKSVSAREIKEEPKYTISRNMIIYDNPLYKQVIRMFKKPYSD